MSGSAVTVSAVSVSTSLSTSFGGGASLISLITSPVGGWSPVISTTMSGASAAAFSPGFCGAACLSLAAFAAATSAGFSPPGVIMSTSDLKNWATPMSPSGLSVGAAGVSATAAGAGDGSAVSVGGWTGAAAVSGFVVSGFAATAGAGGDGLAGGFENAGLGLAAGEAVAVSRVGAGASMTGVASPSSFRDNR
ncbi:MAG: hypothetical protein HYS64_02835 [Rhodospirillales bacterium]|nr:hypothetical protein [Rhodospirillales bacterium]